MNAQRKEKLKRRLQESRARLLKAHPDFAGPLREMVFVATKDVFRISTNGTCIYFDPDWLQKLENASLDFILAHQLGHLKLRHFERPQYYRGDRFHLAADIVVNARLREMGWQAETQPGIGKIYCETFFPCRDGADLTAETAMGGVPFDPANLPEGKRRRYMIDSDRWWEASFDRGETGVVILCPDDPDPRDLSGEEDEGKKKRKRKPDEMLFQPTIVRTDIQPSEPPEPSQEQDQPWEMAAADAIQKLRSVMRDQSWSREQDGFQERLWQRPNRPGLDWKTLLRSFIKEDIYDYSFSPPDRRYQEDALFLPDFNVPEKHVKDVLFMVDTSGSVTDEMLNAVCRELCCALEQFGGALSGALGIFDTKVRAVYPIQQTDDFRNIIPVGGGGTDYGCVFAWCDGRKTAPPSCVVIFTDGKADFPDVSAAREIPVLWLFTTETPPHRGGSSRLFRMIQSGEKSRRKSDMFTQEQIVSMQQIHVPVKEYNHLSDDDYVAIEDFVGNYLVMHLDQDFKPDKEGEMCYSILDSLP